MRSRYYVREKERAHFITSSIVGWLPVFTTQACCEILVQALDYCRRSKELKLYAWVIMDNHFHAVVHAPELSGIIMDLKKFTARRLLAQLKAERRDWLLELLAKARAAHTSCAVISRSGRRAVIRRRFIRTKRGFRRLIISMPIRCVAAGWLRPITGVIPQRTSGCRESSR